MLFKKNSVNLSNCAISFLVDNLPLHYYQAEQLLHSLEKNTSVKKENIIVHCTDRVDKVFIDYLIEEKISYKIVIPYLDGTYCNKLTQLDSFTNKEKYNLDGVLLLDTDMFFLSDPLIPDVNAISGKVVDAPNPTISTLTRIYDEANLAIPPLVKTDWILENNTTIATNFNGGFYYIPSKNITTINTLWKKWATWLFKRPKLFEIKAKTIHTDQVSMSMAIVDSGLKYITLATNENCPIHSSLPARLIDKNRPVSVLHYHREINKFGFLTINKVNNPTILDAINRANQTISTIGKSNFYANYRRNLIQPLKKPGMTPIT